MKDGEPNSLADALPAQIARVTAKKERWQQMMRDHPELGAGMALAIAMMQAEIDRAVRAMIEGDVTAMLDVHKALAAYSDDD